MSMLVCVEGFTADDGSVLRPGVSHVRDTHELAIEHPEKFASLGPDYDALSCRSGDEVRITPPGVSDSDAVIRLPLDEELQRRRDWLQELSRRGDAVAIPRTTADRFWTDVEDFLAVQPDAVQQRGARRARRRRAVDTGTEPG